MWLAAVAFTLAAGSLQTVALAHDSGLSNGLFRTRDAGATWLPVNPGSFVSGALALAVHPVDPHHLLLATDSGLVRSRNGGRDWETEAPDLLRGPAYAVAFDVEGGRAMVSGAVALYRTEGDGWRATRTPTGSAPARALVSGGVPGRVYLAGWTGLYRTNDWGRAWNRVGDEIKPDIITALVVAPDRPDHVYALAGGRVWVSTNSARSWRSREDGLLAEKIEALTLDHSVSSRLWGVGAGRVFRRDDPAVQWQPVGTPIPDPQAIARGIAVSDNVMVVLTDRGLFRSQDAGARWQISSTELPNHAEAGLLARDVRAPATFYAGFGQTSTDKLKQLSSPMSREIAGTDVAILVGGYASVGLFLLGVCILARRVTRATLATTPDRDA